MRSSSTDALFGDKNLQHAYEIRQQALKLQHSKMLASQSEFQKNKKNLTDLPRPGATQSNGLKRDLNDFFKKIIVEHKEKKTLQKLRRKDVSGTFTASVSKRDLPFEPDLTSPVNLKKKSRNTPFNAGASTFSSKSAVKVNLGPSFNTIAANAGLRNMKERTSQTLQASPKAKVKEEVKMKFNPQEKLHSLIFDCINVFENFSRQSQKMDHKLDKVSLTTLFSEID